MDNTSPVERSEDLVGLTNDEVKHSFGMTSWRDSRLAKIKARYSAFKEEVDRSDETMRTLMYTGMAGLESRFQNVLLMVKVTSLEPKESLVDRVFLHVGICQAFNRFDVSFFEQQKLFRSKTVNKANKKLKESIQNILAATFSNQLPRGMARQLAKQEHLMLHGNVKSNTTSDASISESNPLRSSNLDERAASPNAWTV